MELIPGLQQSVPHTSKDQAFRIDRFFVRDDVCPTETVRWVKRDVPELGNGHRYYVEAPEVWSDRSVGIAALHYLAPQDKDSIRSLILRVVNTIHSWAVEDGTFDPEASRPFRYELTYILIHQIASFNSPVYYNIGLSETPQCSACFINSVADSMDSITELAKREARIFQSGSGAGVNWSDLRSSHEAVNGMGNSSGPVPFMIAHDSLASKIKSGGRKRRAARMDILDMDHPDICAFIRDKADTEKIARMMAENGWSTDMTDPQSTANILPHQSTNLSVRIPDAFMEAALSDGDWDLHYRNQEGVQSTVKARELLRELAQACWECGDPGVQFHDTINSWSLLQDTYSLRASNPCAEFVGRDNTSCNLASINVLPPRRDPLTYDEIRQATRVLITAQNTIIHHAGYPHEEITKNANEDRDVGLGWANLGALCMYHGYPYDSDEARNLVANICSWTTANAYDTSIDLAQKHGAFHRAEECSVGIKKIMSRHADAIENQDPNAPAIPVWSRILHRVEHGELPRNASVTLCAPTGTIGLLMDCDTTGCEPAISLQAFKKLSYGGEMKLGVRTVVPALQRLGYSDISINRILASDTAINRILAQIETEGHVEGLVAEEHLPVFDTALASGPSKRSIHYMGHLKMLAAMQPHISMAISKTVNLPNDVTVADVEQCYIDAWKMGIKNVALFRDGCKAAQAVYAKKKAAAEIEAPLAWGQRRKLPPTRQSVTHKISLGGTEVYAHVGLYEDGTPGELFFTANCGSTIDGLLDSVGIAVSHALQYGAPLEKLCQKYQGIRFAPDGWGQMGETSRHFSSILDYIFSWISDTFLTPMTASVMPPKQLESREPHIEFEDRTQIDANTADICPNCGNLMVPNGGQSCKLCMTCGSTVGGCG